MAEDELCDIIYQMVKHDWQVILHTSVVDNNSDKREKPSSQCKKNANSDENAKRNKPKGSYNTKRSSKYYVLCEQFGGNPTLHNTKDCRTHMVTSRKCPASDHMTVSDLQASNLKLSKKLKKHKKKRRKYESDFWILTHIAVDF
eukprot:615698-Ditylum_brightwellii.AAC.1